MTNEKSKSTHQNIFVSIYLSIYLSLDTYYIYIYIPLHIYIYIYIYYTYIYIIHIYIYYTYIYIYIYIYLYICIYIYKFFSITDVMKTLLFLYLCRRWIKYTHTHRNVFETFRLSALVKVNLLKQGMPFCQRQFILEWWRH